MIGEVDDISISEALKDKNLQKAIYDEYKSLVEMNTWKLVKPPKDVKLLSCLGIMSKVQRYFEG